MAFPQMDSPSTSALPGSDALLIDLSVAAIFGEPVLGSTSGGGAGLARTAEAFEQVARLLKGGDEMERSFTIPVSLLTLRELLAWAAVTAACNRLNSVPGEEDRWRELEDRRQAIEQELARRTTARAEDQSKMLLRRLLADRESRWALERELHQICSRLECGTTVSEEAVVEILRAVVAAVADDGQEQAIPSED